MSCSTLPQLDSEVRMSRARSKMGAIPMPSVANRAECVASRGKRWGVVLAGGDGTRLRSLTQFICGDDRPKQFCALLDGATLLEHTLRRAERVIPSERLLVSLTSHHHPWYSREARIRSGQSIVQPANKGTATAIAHSLLSVAKLDPNAVVAILPSDHHYADESLFLTALESAFEIAADRPQSLILFGATPNYPEVEYGWIRLGSPAGQDGNALFHVRAFQEKPSLAVARRLLRGGAVWNMFVMVGRVSAFLGMIQAALPELYGMLEQAPLWQGTELTLVPSLYEPFPSLDLSQRVLAVSTERLLALRLNSVGWSDLGDPGRALMAALDHGGKPEWAQEWQRTARMSRPAQLSEPYCFRAASA